MSIYVEISKIIAGSSGFNNCIGLNLSDTTLSDNQINKIESILGKLANNEINPGSELEYKEILESDFSNGKKRRVGTRVRFSAEKDNKLYLFLIKTAKPNTGEFSTFKKKLLTWIARLRKDNVRALLVFPYNPYHPDDYKHFAKGNLFEIGKDLLIGKDYWDFIGGNNTYTELIDIIKKIGSDISVRIKEKIDNILNIS